MTTPPLSPAAQETLDAAVDKAHPAFTSIIKPVVAAGLRATAEQPYSVPAYYRGDEYSMYVKGVEAERERIRSIANELDQP